MKTPEEIKKGLECAVDKKCIGKECSYFNEEYACIRMVQVDAFALIQQLEADLKQEKADHQHTYECAEVFQKENAELLEKIKRLERERDAAIYDLKKTRECRSCKHIDVVPSEQPCKSCGIRGRNYEWRGPCKENGGN